MYSYPIKIVNDRLVLYLTLRKDKRKNIQTITCKQYAGLPFVKILTEVWIQTLMSKVFFYSLKLAYFQQQGTLISKIVQNISLWNSNNTYLMNVLIVVFSNS